MLLEVARRLAAFGPIDEYRYLGLGSVWFSDFQLFHRAFGISEMVSIEREKSAEARIRANLPFAAVTPIFDTTAKVLPALDWSKRQIVWLDYDDPISPGVLADAATVARKSPSGSLIAISVQVHHALEVDEATAVGSGSALNLFKGRYSNASLPVDLAEDDFHGRPFAKLSADMIEGELENALVARNTAFDADSPERLMFHRICRIAYADGAPMMTVVGVVVSEGEAEIVGSLHLDRLDFVPDDGIVRIEVPKITPREARMLEARLPSSGSLSRDHVPGSDASAFAKFYRYLPSFAAIDH